MSTGMKRRWWRAAAVATIGGGVVAGGWLGLARSAQADPPRPAPDKAAVWTRSNAPPSSAPAPQPQSPLPDSKVVPVAATVPTIPAIPPTVVPAVTQVPAVPPVGVPTLPVPEFRPVAAVIPEPPTVPQLPKVEAPVNPLPATPLPKIESPVIPVLPVPNQAVKPVAPLPVEVAPSAPPLKSVDPVQPPRPVQPENNLRPADDGNTVKPDVPMLPPGPSPKVPTVDPPVPTPVPTVSPVMAPTIPPAFDPGPQVPVNPVSRPKPMEEPIRPTEKFTFPLPTNTGPGPQPTVNPRTTPGDNPMTIVPKQTVVAAVTGIALAFTPSPSPVAAQDPVQLKKDLDDANKKLADAEKEIKRLRALLEGKKDETGTVLPSDPGAIEEIKRLKNQVAALEKKVDEMQKSTSFRMGQAVPTTGKGTVRVVNEYPVVVTIVVNDKSYRVEPNTALNIDVPVGDFSYQLLQTGAGATPTKSTIKEKEVVTLRIK